MIWSRTLWLGETKVPWFRQNRRHTHPPYAISLHNEDHTRRPNRVRVPSQWRRPSAMLQTKSKSFCVLIFPSHAHLNKWNRQRRILSGSHRRDQGKRRRGPLLAHGFREAAEESHGAHSVWTNRLTALVLALFLCLINGALISEDKIGQKQTKKLL